MNSTQNTFFHRTFSIKGSVIILVLILISFLSGYLIHGIFNKEDIIPIPVPSADADNPAPLKLPDTEIPFVQKVYTFDRPEKMEFAGEPVPLHIPDIWERMDYEIHLNIYFHSSTISLIKKANRWLPIISEILKEHNIPDDFKYLPLIESGLENVVSHRQAVGYWQLLESTAKELGLEVTNEVDERYDPIKSTEAAIKYLKRSYNKFGNWTNVAASYNVGMRGMEDRMDEQGMTSYYDLLLNSETARYVFRLLAIKEIMNHPAKYGYDIPKQHLYSWIPTEPVTVEESIDNLAEFARAQGINYKILKRYNPWLRKTSLKVKKGKTYQIQIPVDKESLMTGME